LLVAFFADRRLAAPRIVAGQLLGIGVLVLVSASAALTALVIPREWIALMGLAPLGLGIRLLLKKEAGAEEVREPAEAGSQSLAVAAVTIANGGDNLGVYIPVFATNLAQVPIYAIVFAVMTLVWCWLARGMTGWPWVGPAVRRYGHVVLPFVLIGLGLYILRGALPLFS
jgi:cadmium resistance protein CadD (predicted permease)